MPFKSEAQRRFMYAKHPRIARRWTAEEKVMKHEPRFGGGSGGHGSRMVEDRDDEVFSKGRFAAINLGAGITPKSRAASRDALRRIERRVSDLTEKPKKKLAGDRFPPRQVTKRYRDYDDERKRQRRIGQAEAVAGLAGGASAAYGGHQVIRDTKARRARLKKPKGVFEIHGKPAAALGAGLAGLAAVPAIRQWSESNRGKPWGP